MTAKKSMDVRRPADVTAAPAFGRGLAGTAWNQGWLALQPELAEATLRPFDGDELRRRWDRLGPGASGLHEDLDWARGERVI